MADRHSYRLQAHVNKAVLGWVWGRGQGIGRVWGDVIQIFGLKNWLLMVWVLEARGAPQKWWYLFGAALFVSSNC